MSRTTPLMAKVKLFSPYYRLILILSQGDYHGQDVQQPSDYTSHPDQTVEVTHEEQKQNWYDLTDERKKQLKVRALSWVVISISHSPRSVVALRQALPSSVEDTSLIRSTRNTKKQKKKWDCCFVFSFIRDLSINRKMPSHGVRKAGQKALRQKLKRSANMVLALPPLGSLSRGAITFPHRLS